MPKYTREDIIETLAVYARDMGSIITLKKYQEWRKLHPKAPSHYHIVKTFGSWHDACAEAGLERVSRTRKPSCRARYVRRFKRWASRYHSKRIGNGPNAITSRQQKRFYIGTVRGQLPSTPSNLKFLNAFIIFLIRKGGPNSGTSLLYLSISEWSSR